MTEQLQQLYGLIGRLPSVYSARSFSELNTVLSKYKNILDYVNSYNAELKRTTLVYYSGISNIMDNIQISLYSASKKEKERAFESAGKELKTDMEALTILICPQPAMADALA